MTKSKLKVAIFGGSGYGGSELLRILLNHPNVEICLVTANEHCSKSVTAVHRNLLGLTDLKFDRVDLESSKLHGIDIAFFALPHGQAMQMIPKLPENIRIVDLSGDFRLNDMETFEKFYGFAHSAAQEQSEFVYGLTETNRAAIAKASRIANPGCFATASILAAAPLIKNNTIEGKIIIDAKTGSSGSGAKPASNTHHPQRTNSFYAYKPFSHQHVPEIEQHLRYIGNFPNELIFMTHSLPVSRGIFASCYVVLRRPIMTEELRSLYHEFYRDSFFVRMVEGSPDINWVKNSNFCDIAVFANGKNAVIFAAIDNLVKGAAGQAVQNMNVMFGLDEKTGLLFSGGNP